MSDPKLQIRFILCGTQFASNLGQAARVMKNMGFERLILVQPRCEVGVEARTAAMRGDEILDRAEFFPSLAAAAREVDLLVGTSARFGPGHPKRTTVRALAEEIAPGYLPGRIGVAFGSEDNGLRREEIELCDWLAEIPAGSGYASLNLAQAVAIVAYELHLALGRLGPDSFLNLAPPEEVRSLLAKAEAALRSLRPPESADLEEVMRRLSRIAGRARLEHEDVNLLRWLLGWDGGKVDSP